MVEEKVSSQSDLRHANEQIEKLRQKLTVAENSLIQTNKNSASGLTNPDSEDFRKFANAIAEKDSLLTARHQELESARREIASVQASLLSVQHERSEAQARVKSLIKETAAQENRIEQFKKDIQMKDLYLKQLGGSGPVSAHYDNNNYEILQQELDKVKLEKVRLLAEASTLKAHYTDREHALQQKQAEMAQELSQLHDFKSSANDQIQHLQHQLEIAQSDLQKPQTDSSSTPHKEEEPKITEEDIARRIREACNAERGKWERKIEADQRQRDKEIIENDKVIFEREQSLAELEMKYRLLEERTLESNAHGDDLLSLSEQLQNEKATVSRAVAQNKELKERLLETKDCFVILTEEKANVELAKQAAEHQVRELTKQLNLEAAGLVGNHPM
uniref:GOLGA2L5 domain-containing protein n=1 Tax=Caenorhabditis tropicalis TaxID=1561998 RepID=A0A1I7TS46_9PELO